MLGKTQERSRYMIGYREEYGNPLFSIELFGTFKMMGNRISFTAYSY